MKMLVLLEFFEGTKIAGFPAPAATAFLPPELATFGNLLNNCFIKEKLENDPI